MNPRIYIALSSFSHQNSQPLNILKDSGAVFDINTTGQRLTKEQVMAKAKGFDGIIAGLEPYDAGVLEALSGLKCISRCGVGVDNVDLKTAKERNIAVLNTPQVVVQPVAELTIAIILDLLRQVTKHSVLMHAQKWERHTGNLLQGKKIGIIGLGRIGRRVAELLRSWNVIVYGVDVHPDEAWAQKQGVQIKSLQEALSQCDIITLHVSAVLEHPFCLGKKEMSSMKKGAYLVNVSRGVLIDESALIEALRSGHLAGAGLDVYEQEPYKGDLCNFSNVVLTPHVATLTQESRLEMEIEATKNIVDFFKLA